MLTQLQTLTNPINTTCPVIFERSGVEIDLAAACTVKITTGNEIAPEIITFTATSPTSFTAVGSVTGALGTVTVDTPATTTYYSFDIKSTFGAFVAGDKLTVTTAPFLFFGGTAELPLLYSDTQVTPAVYVGFVGETPAQSGDSRAGKGAINVVDQEWITVIAVNSQADIVSGQRTRDIVGPLIDLVRNKLQGFQPFTDWLPLRRGPGLQPEYDPSGYCYYPLRWIARSAR